MVLGRRACAQNLSASRVEADRRQKRCLLGVLLKLIFFCGSSFFLAEIVFSVTFFPNSALPPEFHSALVSRAPTDSVIEDHARNPLSRAVGALTVSSQKDFGADRENPIHKSSDLAPKLRHKTRAASKL